MLDILVIAAAVGLIILGARGTYQSLWNSLFPKNTITFGVSGNTITSNPNLGGGSSGDFSAIATNGPSGTTSGFSPSVPGHGVTGP